ncbi:dihydrodipicolinate synthase [Caldicellulosiruptor hydrothermalis 108]|uniref:4-hydroxy-tetrahydrodipicolinate synthase n=1 Tax=Caldicellulosiruptor hydrothermalis (strain DSM 18901 / VKM B-2411 / 108) TaxID=632292 RepID=E4Q7Z0_CALH1|nr:4-hydroxy-tetrahydrodipicolinate synthase [Caldicellulosiruptor hydrothermalis]ADQ07908.1 dihydrodipicolinate synthase [Caldicellulosiruptor hydrothermalis 108]
MNKFGKILLPVVTPFDENEKINYEAYQQLLEYVIEKNYCDTIVVTGTTGEFNTLTFEERKDLFKFTVEVVGNRKPIIAGTGCASTRETIALTNEAFKLGISTCMIVAPYYCKPTQEDIYIHYKRVVENTGAEILLYNIPLFTGVNIEPQTVKKLAQNKQIIGIKDEAGMNPTQLTEYYYATKDINPEFLLFNGDDLMLMPTLAQGAVGIVSGGAHLVGDKIRKVFEEYEKGNIQEALSIYRKLYKLFKYFTLNGRVHPNPVLREAIEIVTGITIGKPRGPLNGIKEEERQILLSILKEYELI